MTQPTRKHEPLSEQGEQQEEFAALYASPEEVDEYLTGQAEGVVICRERGRHDYPSVRREGLHFDGVDTTTGLHIRRVRCRCCNLVDLIELWDVQHRGDRVTRVERVSSRPDYSPRGVHGERYLGPAGHGRMTPKMVRNAVATTQLKGVSFKELRKEALRGNQQRER